MSIIPKIFVKNFHYDFYELRKIPPCYSEVGHQFSEFLKAGSSESLSTNDFIVALDAIPPYLGINKNDLDKRLSCFEGRYRIGFAMDLSSAENANEYLKGQLSKKVFKNLRQDRQRLIKQHEITFKNYYGYISSETCHILLEKLREFVEGRFEGRTSKHDALKNWGRYQKSVSDQINAGNASLFVAFDKDEPISISLNYHFKEVLNMAINSYSKDYSRFSLGRQMFFWQLEWCYEHNYRLIDLGWFPFEYKTKFCNAVFRYYTQVIYPRSSLFLKAFAYFHFNKMKLIYYLVMLKYSKFDNPEKKFKDRWMKYQISD
jgi:hypothetical protein